MNKQTLEMLNRLAAVLTEHRTVDPSSLPRPLDDAEALRRISMALHRWHELECNEDVVRGKRGLAGGFVHDENGSPFICRHDGIMGAQNRYYAIPDRERGARNRLAKIMARYPDLQAYVQTDPRGCALYILRPGDVPEGADVSSCYSRGIAVYR